jgi:hypothetical protein
MKGEYKARLRFGQADYGWYADQLGIKLIWAVRLNVKARLNGSGYLCKEILLPVF